MFDTDRVIQRFVQLVFLIFGIVMMVLPFVLKDGFDETKYAVMFIAGGICLMIARDA
jgi:hypothetical protein